MPGMPMLHYYSSREFARRLFRKG